MKMLPKIAMSLLLAAVAPLLGAAPVGYSINSDSASDNADSLYRVDLGSGIETRVGPVLVGGESRIDVEGLAFAPDGTLYGVDDSEMTLFPINPDTGLVQVSDEVRLSGLSSPGSNDFGMTFTCDGSLYVTSVTRQTLYRLGLDGKAEAVGPEGSLGAPIAALAAYGEPAELYGLGNGLDSKLNEITPVLYRIDTMTGAATVIGELGAARVYAEGGLAFDDSGQLWAITDRRDQIGAPLPSELMKIDRTSGAASDVRTLGEAGFESLAITIPRGCGGMGGDTAHFRVQKQFVDGNDELATTLNIRCNSGLPLEQSIEVLPNGGVLGSAEVTFTVSDFTDGELDCEVSETTPDGYYPSYECFSTGDCSVTTSACSFSGISRGGDNLCVIRNYPTSVAVVVRAEWFFGEGEPIGNEAVQVDLACRNLIDGDGAWEGGEMHWSWLFTDGTPDQVATLQSRYDASVECRATQLAQVSAIESVSSCADWTDASGGLTCVVSNTAFFEGIPTLGRSGLILFVLLMLGSGLAVLRRP